MKLRNSRFIRMGSRVGAGVVVGALLAVVPLSPAGATHTTGLTLDDSAVQVGTPTAVLNGSVKASCDGGTGPSYAWTLTSPNGVVSPSSQAEGAGDLTSYTLTVNTASLAPGSYTVSATVTFTSGQCVVGGGGGPASITDTATLKVTGRKGSFGCSAYAARTQTDYQPANPSFSPCRDDNNYFAQLQPILGFGNIGAVRATTASQPDDLNAVKPAKTDSATAQGEVAQVALNVNGVSINLGAVWARARVDCSGGWTTPAPKFSTAGGVATLVVNGKGVAVASGYVSIWLPAVRIELNKVTKSNSGKVVTRQAVKVTNRLNGKAIIIGEANVGYSGTPCSGGVF